jgi:hypothetical protein
MIDDGGWMEVGCKVMMLMMHLLMMMQDDV